MKKPFTNAFTQTALAALFARGLFHGSSMVLAGLLAATPAVYAADEGAEFNFVNVDIETVVKAISHNQGIPFIVDPRVKGNLTLVTEKPLSKAQVLSLFTSLIRVQGNTVVMGEGYAKVVPESDAKLHSSPTQIAGSGSPVAKGDQIVSQIFRLNYESSVNLVTILRPLISPNNTINANPGNNTLVITDYADNVTRLGKIIAALDTPSSTDIDIIPIRYAIASDIAQMVTRLTESSAGPDGGRISALADSRTNAVVLRAPSVARANFAKSIIAKLDQPTQQAGNVHVVYLKNADAVKLAQTLRAVVSSDSSTAASAISSSNNAGNAGGLQNSGIAGPGQAPGGQQSGALASTPAPQTLSSGGAAGFIQADAATNTLIITASEPVYRNLRTVIDQLDARRAQVYIESLIVEVTSDRLAEFGIQWLGLSGNKGTNYRIGGASTSGQAGPDLVNLALAARGAGATTSTTAASAASSPLTGGLSLGLFRQINGQLNLGALATALESNGNANILSTPNLLTLDNEEAKIIVGQNVPFQTGSFTQTGTAGANPFSTFERKDVGLMLRVRPQISEGGTIKMSIFQEMSSVESGTATNAGGVTTNKRSIETNVLADDNQIIVLGGLIDDKVSDNVDKVPGLGDIPVLGNLFKSQKRQRTKTNLLVFLRPVVIRTAEQSAELSGNRYDFIRGVGDAHKPEKTLLLPDLGNNDLPALDHGKLPSGSFIKGAPLPATTAPAATPDGKK
jgi:general secretion pathway protein D